MVNIRFPICFCLYQVSRAEIFKLWFVAEGEIFSHIMLVLLSFYLREPVWKKWMKCRVKSGHLNPLKKAKIFNSKFKKKSSSKHQNHVHSFQSTLLCENSCSKLQAYSWFMCYNKREERHVCDKTLSQWWWAMFANHFSRRIHLLKVLKGPELINLSNMESLFFPSKVLFWLQGFGNRWSITAMNWGLAGPH